MDKEPTTTKKPRLTIRLSRKTIAFSALDKESEKQVRYEPYTVKSGMSLAANLREALKECELPQNDFGKAQVMIDTPVLMVPTDEFGEDSIATLYRHSFIGYDNDVVLHTVLPDLNAVAAFSIGKDLHIVIEDNFSDVRYLPLMLHVWNHLHVRSFTGTYRKLYAYFHNKQLDIFSFDKNRFKFTNSFEASHAKDAIYFMLYVWKQMGLDTHKDELHLVGEMPAKDDMLADLRRYLQKVYIINPSAEFNRAPITQIKGLPFDLLSLYVKRN